MDPVVEALTFDFPLMGIGSVITKVIENFAPLFLIVAGLIIGIYLLNSAMKMLRNTAESKHSSDYFKSIDWSMFEDEARRYSE